MKHFSDDGCNVQPKYDESILHRSEDENDSMKEYEFSVFHHEEHDPMADYEFSIMHHDD